jgi:excisionase family DNA binding protein
LAVGVGILGASKLNKEFMKMMEGLMTIGDVSALTKIKVGTLRKFVLKRQIPFVKLGAGLRFRTAEIEAWIESCAVAAVNASYVVEQSDGSGELFVAMNDVR